MSEPTFTEATEDLWASLPAVYREEDRRQPVPVGGFPMKRFIAAVADQVGEVFTVIERADFETADARDDPSQAVSDLASADQADAAWLPWLGQLLGLPDVNLLPSEAARRDAIRSATTGFRAGTKSAIAGAAQTVLTGDRRVELYDHSVVSRGDGGEWDVLLVTRGTETPVTSAQLIAAVIAAGAKPAGVILHHKTFETTWGAIETGLPTWADWNSRTWTQIEETGLS